MWRQFRQLGLRHPATSSQSRIAGSGQSATSAPMHEFQDDFSAQERPGHGQALSEVSPELP